MYFKGISDFLSDLYQHDTRYTPNSQPLRGPVYPLEGAMQLSIALLKTLRWYAKYKLDFDIDENLVDIDSKKHLDRRFRQDEQQNEQQNEQEKEQAKEQAHKEQGWILSAIVLSLVAEYMKGDEGESEAQEYFEISKRELEDLFRKRSWTFLGQGNEYLVRLCQWKTTINLCYVKFAWEDGHPLRKIMQYYVDIVNPTDAED